MRRKSLKGDLDAQISLFSKLYSDLNEKDEAIQMCGKLRDSCPFFMGMYRYLNIIENKDHVFEISPVGQTSTEQQRLVFLILWPNQGWTTSRNLRNLDHVGHLSLSWLWRSYEYHTSHVLIVQKAAAGGNEFGHSNLGVTYMDEQNY